MQLSSQVALPALDVDLGSVLLWDRQLRWFWPSELISFELSVCIFIHRKRQRFIESEDMSSPGSACLLRV